MACNSRSTKRAAGSSPPGGLTVGKRTRSRSRRSRLSGWRGEEAVIMAVILRSSEGCPIEAGGSGARWRRMSATKSASLPRSKRHTAGFRAERGHDRDGCQYHGDDARQGQGIVVAEALRQSGLQLRGARGEQVAQLIGKAGERPAQLVGR